MVPDVSVVIVVRNGATTIRRQLDALSAQVGAPPFEVLVVDNGSSDGTRDVVEKWIAEGTGSAETAQIVDASNRPGIPFARNTGARSSRGRVIAWCDADDVVDAGWVAAMSSIQSGLAGGRILARRPDGSPDPAVFPAGLTHTEYLPHGGNCNMGVVREHFFEVGGYDESLPPYGCEDVDISWRIQEAGYPVTYLPEAVIDFSITPRSRVITKTFRSAKARMAVGVRHPVSFRYGFPTVASVARDAVWQTVLLPYRLFRPAPVTRSRRMRSVVGAYGRAAGYWTYVVKNRPAHYVTVDREVT